MTADGWRWILWTLLMKEDWEGRMVQGPASLALRLQRVRGATRPVGGNILDLAIGPVGLLDEYELLAPLGASDHKVVQVWLGGWQAGPVATVELTLVWSRVNWVELLLQAQRIDWKHDVTGPHLARGTPWPLWMLSLSRRRNRTRPKWTT